MGPDDGGSGQCLAAKLCESFNVEAGRWDLSQVKDATEKTGFLIIIFSRAGRLASRVCVVGSRHPFRPVFHPMMM
jgi:hypothetical protein